MYCISSTHKHHGQATLMFCTPYPLLVLRADAQEHLRARLFRIYISIPAGPHASNVATSSRPASTSSPDYHIVGGDEASSQTGLLSPSSSSLTTGTIPIVTAYTNSVSDSDTEDMIAFDVKPIQGRLPQSSYTEEDSLFTWTDITGTYIHTVYNMKSIFMFLYAAW